MSLELNKNIVLKQKILRLIKKYNSLLIQKYNIN